MRNRQPIAVAVARGNRWFHEIFRTQASGNAVSHDSAALRRNLWRNGPVDREALGFGDAVRHRAHW